MKHKMPVFVILQLVSRVELGRVVYLIAHPHLLVRATNEQFLLARATFRVGLANESHWM